MPDDARRPDHAGSRLTVAALLVLVIVVGASTACTFRSKRADNAPAVGSGSDRAIPVQWVPLDKLKRYDVAGVDLDAYLAEQPSDEIDPAFVNLVLAYEEGVARLEHVDLTQARLVELARQVRRRFRRNATPKKKAAAIVAYLFEEAGFAFDETDPLGKKWENLFLNSVVYRKKGYCLSLSMVALSIAYYLDVPLAGVRAPGHFFVRAGQYADYESINFEMTRQGVQKRDSAYRQQYHINPNAIGRGAYLMNLDGREIFADLLSNLGSLYLSRGDAKGAIAHYTRGLTLDRDNPHLWYNRGAAKERIDDLPGAVADYREAIARDAWHYESLCARGNLYLEKGDARDGLADLEQAILARPRRARAFVVRGVHAAKSRDLAAAEADLNHALKLERDNPDAVRNLAQLLLEAGRIPEARQLLTDFLSRRGGTPEGEAARVLLARLAAVSPDQPAPPVPQTAPGN